MKIGIMGGTFNPIHNAHLSLAAAAKEQYSLDVIWFMPSGLPAHKSNQELAPAEHRLNMVKLAIAGLEAFAASDFELKREGYTYTYETLTALKENYPDDTFYFIIGGDSLDKFSTWVHPEIIAKKAILLAAGRSGYTETDLKATVEMLQASYQAKIFWIQMPECSVSSQFIREKIHFNEENELCNEVPVAVMNYIRKNDIYSPTEYILSLQQKLNSTLHEKRYLHTLGVAYLAASLAMCHGFSHRKALIAGLLHDCAKEIPEQELLSTCLELNLPVRETEKELPFLLHGVYGAYLAKQKYGIMEEEIINAIRNHTVGRPDMTAIEQAVFLADYLESERRHETVPPLDDLRKLAFQSMDQATILVLENTIHYFEATGKKMDPTTKTVLDFYRKKSAGAEKTLSV